MGNSRIRNIAWLIAALAVGFPHVTVAGDAGPGKEVGALRHDAAIVIGDRLGTTAISIDEVHIAGRNARVTWHTASAGGTDEFERLLGVWVDSKRASDTVHALVGVRFSPSVPPFTIEARLPTEAESWRNQVLHGGGNAYAFFTLRFSNEQPVAFPGGSVEVWLPYYPPQDVKYELTLAHAAQPLEPVYGTLDGSVTTFRMPGFTLPAHAKLIGELDGN